MANSEGNKPVISAPKINLDSLVANEIEDIEQEVREKRAEEESRQILNVFYSEHKGIKDIDKMLLRPESLKKEVLSSILSLYINNSNSLDSAAYSLYVTQMSEKIAQPNSIELALTSQSIELKRQVTFDLFTKLYPSYMKEVDPDDFCAVMERMRHLNLDAASIKSYIVKPSDIKEQLARYAKVLNELENDDSGKLSEKRSIETVSYFRHAITLLENFKEEIESVEFSFSSSSRINFFSALLDNLQGELESYIKSNPEEFKNKVMAFHKKQEISSDIEYRSSSKELESLSLSAQSKKSKKVKDEPDFPSYPQPQPQGYAPSDKNSSFIQMLKNIVLYIFNKDPEIENKVPFVELTNKEKILNESSSAFELLDKLKTNALFVSDALTAPLTALQIKIKENLEAINLCSESYFSALELENYRVLNRTIMDLAANANNAAKLSSEHLAPIVPEIEKILLSALELSSHLAQETINAYAQSVQKEAQISAKLAAIRSQAQAPKTMSLNSKR